MHTLSFALKRAHLSTLARHKPLAARFDLTPARFDVMVVILERGGGCGQSDIFLSLGLSPSTVSKMLKAMEARGLVWRAPTECDLRRRLVGLTRYGLECVRQAIRTFIRVDDVRGIYDALHRTGRAFVAKAVRTVRHIARGLGDRSTHGYRSERPDADAVAAAEAHCAKVLREIRQLEAIGIATVVAERPPGLAVRSSVEPSAAAVAFWKEWRDRLSLSNPSSSHNATASIDGAHPPPPLAPGGHPESRHREHREPEGTDVGNRRDEAGVEECDRGESQARTPKNEQGHGELDSDDAD